jgi:hypothetical protein
MLFFLEVGGTSDSDCFTYPSTYFIMLDFLTGCFSALSPETT